jgi:hypothetical protein
MNHSGEWTTEVQAFITAQLAGGIARTSTYTRRQHLHHVASRVPCGPWALTSDDLAGYMAEQTHALRAYNRSPAPASEAEAGDRIRDRKFFG